MAIIPGTKKILKSDIPDAPPWFDKIIGVINGFLDTVIGALRGKLTFRENFLAQVKEFTFVHAQEQQILYAGLLEFNGVIITRGPEESSDDYAIESWKARRIKTDIFGLTVYFRGAGTTQGKVKFVVLG